MASSVLSGVLWELLTADRVQGLNTDGSAGHAFEDLTLELVYAACLEKGHLQPFPPRYTLQLPTVSGLHHQVDVGAREGAALYHIIECKFKHTVPVEHLYALSAKVMDYAIGARVHGHNSRFRAYMLASPAQCNDNMYRYALAWGITLVAPGNYPPPEYMLAHVPNGTPLASRLERLVKRSAVPTVDDLLAGPRRADELFAEWRNCIQEWDGGRYGR